MERDQERFETTAADVREAIRTVFYAWIPAVDVVGQDRVTRASQRVLEALGR